jgi:hypothetical protein
MDVAALGLVLMASWLLVALIVRAASGRRRVRNRPPVSGPARNRPPRRQPPRADVEHVLYAAHWQFTDRPMYFGISNDLAARAKRHAATSWWWRFSDRELHVIGRFPTRAAALAAERRAIPIAVRAGERLTNTHHNPRPVRKGDVRVVR